MYEGTDNASYLEEGRVVWGMYVQKETSKIVWLEYSLLNNG